MTSRLKWCLPPKLWLIFAKGWAQLILAITVIFCVVSYFSSPHLVSVRERIRLNGRPISQSLFTKYFWSVYKRVEAGLEPGARMPPYFRFLTLLAYQVTAGAHFVSILTYHVRDRGSFLPVLAYHVKELDVSPIQA